MRYGNLQSALLAVAGLVALPSLGQSPTNSLGIGSKAPALQVKWVKGTPIPAFEPGRLYVVEFWATWCGPCRAAMPHLSELAQTYANRVEVIGVNILEKNSSHKPYEDFYPSVKAFVTNMGNKMAYHVAMDTNGTPMVENWMKASGEQGIPSTFLIRENKIIWIGHPNDLDKVISQVLAGTYDMASYRANFETNRKKDQDRAAPLIALNNEVTAAIAAKDYAKAIATIDDSLTKFSPDFKPMLYIMKFMTLCKCDMSRALAFIATVKAEAPNLVPNLAYGVLNEENLPKEAYQFAIDQFAEKLSQPGIPVPLVHNAMATCYARMGSLDCAVASEEKAIATAQKALASGQFQGLVTNETLCEYRKALESYKSPRKK